VELATICSDERLTSGAVITDLGTYNLTRKKKFDFPCRGHSLLLCF